MMRALATDTFSESTIGCNFRFDPRQIVESQNRESSDAIPNPSLPIRRTTFLQSFFFSGSFCFIETFSSLRKSIGSWLGSPLAMIDQSSGKIEIKQLFKIIIENGNETTKKQFFYKIGNIIAKMLKCFIILFYHSKMITTTLIAYNKIF
jgi:hypothetical protein